MDTKILEYMERFKAIKDKKLSWLRRRPDGHREVELADLTRRLHQVGKVSLPMPTLFSLNMMERFFSGIEKIDLQNNFHVAAVRFFLNNGMNAPLAEMSAKDLERAIYREMGDIPLAQLPETVECINQIFLAIQKKTVEQQKQKLEHLLETLQIDPGTAGQN